MSTVTLSPVFIRSHSRDSASTGYSSPVATQFRKKIRAYDSATTTLHPAAPMATGACSRDDPHPKLAPPIIIEYSVLEAPGGMYLGYLSSGRPHIAKLPNFSYSSGLEGTRVKCSAGMIWSVSMLSATTNARPVIILPDGSGAASARTEREEGLKEAGRLCC